MTETPETPAYMPPEAMIANPRYDTSIDEFSYGIMMIHVFCGKWPEPQCGQIKMEEGRMIPITEAGRRQVFLQDIRSDHPLKNLILKCIHNDPKQRACASEIERYMYVDTPLIVYHIAGKFGRELNLAVWWSSLRLPN